VGVSESSTLSDTTREGRIVIFVFPLVFITIICLAPTFCEHVPHVARFSIVEDNRLDNRGVSRP
jgi:hypothetical protein